MTEGERHDRRDPRAEARTDVAARAATGPVPDASGEGTGTVERLVDLAQRLQAVCLARGLTVATAESCTGGLVAHGITEVAGSSGYFRGGVVSYADDGKVRLLDVPPDVLDGHGAVSAQTARAMAVGARAAFRVDVAVAVTGIAGPGGGTDEKPVGLTYVAVADGTGADVRRFRWTGDRTANKALGAEAALALLLDRVDR